MLPPERTDNLEHDAMELAEASENDAERITHLEMEKLTLVREKMSVQESLDSVQGEKRSLQEALNLAHSRHDIGFEGETALSASRADHMAQKMVTERMAKEIRGLKAEADKAVGEAKTLLQ